MSNIQVFQFFIDQGQGYLAVKVMVSLLIVSVPSQAIMCMKQEHRRAVLTLGFFISGKKRDFP